ncbi:MAG: two-component regulator propeller domain-containing protein [Candidatus Zhuqueibacterota bacterium]
MKKIALIVILLFQITSTNDSHAQITDLYLEYVSSKFPTLSGSAHIIQDRYGFMWFGSRSGLQKFDGYQVVVYRHNPADSLSLSSNFITAMVEDPHEGLWIGTVSGLNRLDVASGKFQRFHHDPGNPNSLSHDYITCLRFDETGILWIGTQQGGLNEMRIWDRNNFDSVSVSRHTHRPEDSFSVSDNYIRFILDDTRHDDHLLWIGTANGLNRFDKKTRTFTRYFHDPGDSTSLASNDLYSIHQDEQGDLWIGACEGWLTQLHRTSDGKFRFRHDRLGEVQKIYSITRDKYDNLWLSTMHHGLYRFNKSTRRIEHIEGDKFQHIDVSYPYTTCFDHTGALWIGTWPHLLKHDPNRKQFRTVAIDPPLNIWSMAIASIAEDDHNSLWIATTYRGILKFNLHRGELSDFAPDSSSQRYLSSRFATSILKDHTGAFWVSTFRGLNRYDPGRDRFVSYFWDADRPDNPDNLLSNYLYCLHEDHQGAIWIGSSRGVSRLDQNRRQFRHYLNRPEQINAIGHYIGAIHQDRAGIFWIGGKGLFQLNPETGQFSRYFANPNDSSGAITAMVFDIVEDSRGFLWVATQNGLYRLHPNQPTIHFTEKNGLPNRYVTGILEDDQGILWISTRTWLTRYDPDTQQFQWFDFRNEFYEQSRFKGKDGALYFGMAKALLSFHPNAIRDNPHKPPVWISNFRVFDKPVTFDRPIPALKEIRLSYRENFFTLDFVALNYTESGNNQYKYQLVGVDPEWVSCGDRRSASYTNVPPGSYEFNVQASNNDGVWNETGASVRIFISPPWWQSDIAYACFVFLVLAAMYGLRQFELRRSQTRNELKMRRFESQKLQEVDRMKSRFFANISHEFRTPLTLILGPLNNLLVRTKNQRLHRELTIMQRNARRLQRLINQLLDLSKIEAGKMKLQARQEDLSALVFRIVQSFESQAKLKEIELTCFSDPAGILVFVDQEKIENIFYNLLSNAIKFTPHGGKVHVRMSLSPTSAGDGADAPGKMPGLDYVRITVEDTGIGIPRQHLEKIFDRFYQVTGKDDSRQGETCTHEHEGTDIGLSLTKELVELHHGFIQVSSAIHVGTTFTIFLPMGQSHLTQEELRPGESPHEAPLEQGAEILESQPASVDSLDASPRKKLPIILIVEDNADLRVYLRDCLRGKYRIMEAIDGEQGLSCAVERIPDLIVSDVMMPRMDGFELCRRVKSDERTSHIPFLLLTARASSESKIMGLELGADDYLIKPFEMAELQTRVKNLIEQRRQLREKFSRNIFLQPSEIAVTSYDQQFLQHVMNLIEQNITRPEFNVTALTQLVGMSRMQLHRKIHALTNLTTSAFIRSLRLKRAADLLRQRADNISQVAYDVGFNNPSYFAECFRQQFGVLPSEYKIES